MLTRMLAFSSELDFSKPSLKNLLHQLYQTMRRTHCDWCIFPDDVDGVLRFNYDMVDMNNPTKTCWSV